MKYMSAEQAGKCGRFIKLPCAIFDSRLSPLAKLLYAYLLNLSTLSAKNGLSDERGVYVFCTLEQASEMLDCSRNTARKHFKQLDEQGLIKRQFRDGEAFRIYLPDPSNLTPSNLDESKDCPPPAQELPDTPTKNDSTPVQNLPPNYTNTNYTDSNYTDCNKTASSPLLPESDQALLLKAKLDIRYFSRKAAGESEEQLEKELEALLQKKTPSHEGACKS